jgi:hypothetical protein
VTGRVAIEYLEGSSMQRGMLARVVPVLSQRNPFDALAWAGVNEALEEGREALIDVLRLASDCGWYAELMQS